jgi:hypothetical protein
VSRAFFARLILVLFSCSGYRPARPKQGSRTLSDVTAPTITIVCEPCGRRGHYNVARLIERHGGDIRMPELLETLADCPKAQSARIHDRCKATYEGLAAR